MVLLSIQDLDRAATDMWDFIGDAPWFILGAFIASFVFTKILASQKVYELAHGIFHGSKLKQAKRLREELTLTETEFTLFTPSEEMDAEDKEVLEAARHHYRRKMRELYKEDE
jgi:hypothetical protein